MKRLINIIHLIISLAVIAYLGRSISNGSTGYTFANATDIIKNILPALFIVALLYVIRKGGIGYKKWVIVLGCMVLIIVSHALYTDTDTFFGGDFTNIYATLTLFMSLFGVFSTKEVQVKGQYSKKAEIIEV